MNEQVQLANQVKIAVIDDHPLFREGVAHILGATSDFEVVAEGESADDAIRIAREVTPQMMLLDVSMPGNGLTAARQISHEFPDMKIIMLTVSESQEHVSAALEAGSHGYVLKGVGAKSLLQSLRQVVGGERIVSPDLAVRLLTQRREVPATTQQDLDASTLTEREEEILLHVSRGLTNKEVAEALNLSEKTIKHYMTIIMQKLRVRNRTEAALWLRRR